MKLFDINKLAREIGWRITGQKSLVTPLARRPVPWRALDVLCVLLLWLVTGITVSLAFSGIHLADDGQTQIYAAIVHSLLTVAITIAYLKFATQATWLDLGFDLRRLPGDVLRGLLAFLLIAPVIYGMQALLVQYFPYQHPVLETVKANRTYLLAMTSAVLVAPLSEEFIFRVFFQGWLEKQAWLGAPVERETLNATAKPVIVAEVAELPYAESSARLADSGNPFASPVTLPENPLKASLADLRENDDLPRLPGTSWWPVLISSLVFACMHIGQGPAPIPLFFLALALGYLYRQTHRLWPSLVVHLLLNSCTMAVICWSLSHNLAVP